MHFNSRRLLGLDLHVDMMRLCLTGEMEEEVLCGSMVKIAP